MQQLVLFQHLRDNPVLPPLLGSTHEQWWDSRDTTHLCGSYAQINISQDLGLGKASTSLRNETAPALGPVHGHGELCSTRIILELCTASCSSVCSKSILGLFPSIPLEKEPPATLSEVLPFGFKIPPQGKAYRA